MNILPVRKPNRLEDYDYSQRGAYFITICTKNRQKLFGKIVQLIQPVNPVSTNPENGRGNSGRLEAAPTELRTEFRNETSPVGAAFCRPLSHRPHDCRPQLSSTNYAIAQMKLNRIGQIVENEIKTLSTIYANTRVDKYVIMPNHVHMIIVIRNGRSDCGRGNSGRLEAAPTELRNETSPVGAAFCRPLSHRPHDYRPQSLPPPTISRMINQWKRAISIKTGFSPWQKSFHDHIIRDLKSYYFIERYIENNPATWNDDCFNIEPRRGGILPSVN